MAARGAGNHKYSYLKGHIRCRHCLKWIDPNNAKEYEENVRLTPRGRRLHKDCHVRSFGSAIFATVPRTRKAMEVRDNASHYY